MAELKGHVYYLRVSLQLTAHHFQSGEQTVFINQSLVERHTFSIQHAGDERETGTSPPDLEYVKKKMFLYIYVHTINVCTLERLKYRDLQVICQVGGLGQRSHALLGNNTCDQYIHEILRSVSD